MLIFVTITYFFNPLVFQQDDTEYLNRFIIRYFNHFTSLCLNNFYLVTLLIDNFVFNSLF